MQKCIFLLALVGLCFIATTHAQLSIGANGVGMPAINLVSVFRFLRNAWLAFTRKPEERVVAEVKESSEARQHNSEMFKGIESKALKILEKVDTLCVEGESDACDLTVIKNEINEETSSRISEDDIRTFLTTTKQEIDKNGNILELEEKIIELIPEPFRAGSWIAVYVALNSVLLGLFLALAAPYYFTGETVESIDNRNDSPWDTLTDSVSLMSYLLDNDETHSLENSLAENCLQNKLCLAPVDTGRALGVTNFVVDVLKFIPGWTYFQDRISPRLHRLGESVTQGRSNSDECKRYICPTYVFK